MLYPHGHSGLTARSPSYPISPHFFPETPRLLRRHAYNKGLNHEAKETGWGTMSGATHWSELARDSACQGGSKGVRHDTCSALLSEAGAHWPLATSPCPFVEPSPSAGGRAHRPLSPCLAYPLPPHTPFLSVGRWCQRSPRT